MNRTGRGNPGRLRNCRPNFPASGPRAKERKEQTAGSRGKEKAAGIPMTRRKLFLKPAFLKKSGNGARWQRQESETGYKGRWSFFEDSFENLFYLSGKRQMLWR